LCQELGRVFTYTSPSCPVSMPVPFLVSRAHTLGPLVRLGWGAFSAHAFGVRRLRRLSRLRMIPLGRLVPLPTSPPDTRAQVPPPSFPLWRPAWLSASRNPAPPAPRPGGPPSAPPRPRPTPPPKSAAPVATPSNSVGRPRSVPSSPPCQCSRRTP